jgi:hypothetical protein
MRHVSSVVMPCICSMAFRVDFALMFLHFGHWETDENASEPLMRHASVVMPCICSMAMRSEWVHFPGSYACVVVTACAVMSPLSRSPHLCEGFRACVLTCA